MAIVSPEYVTGRRLWLLGMPSTSRPRAVGIEGGDPGLGPGVVSAITKAGPGSGVLSIYSGGPTDTFAVRVEIMATGGAGVGTFRTRLQTTEAWSLTQTIPAADTAGVVLYELPDSGMVLRFSGTFDATATYDFSTTEAAKQAELRKGISGEIARVLRTRGSLPLAEWGVDLELLAARCLAWELLGLRGYTPRNEHDRVVMYRAKRAWSELRKIREEITQGDWPGQDSPRPGIACSSQDPQGVELW